MLSEFDANDLDIVWASSTAMCKASPADLLIVDLSDMPYDLTTSDLCSVMSVDTVLALRGGKVVPAEILHQCSIIHPHIVFTALAATHPYDGIMAYVARRLHEISPSQVADKIISDTPSLAPAKRFIVAVLEAPWMIRRPRDLCRHIGESMACVKESCQNVGVDRIEHLITLARWLAFEFLISRNGITAASAMNLVGVADRSNFERQKQRASYVICG